MALALLCMLLLTGCSGKTEAQLPNPATQNCEDLGYASVIRTADDGSQTGYCILPDGTECEEWELFRGECP